KAGAPVILPNTIVSVRAAQNLVPPVPVVMMSISDPIGTGLVASLARAGGHTTGVATLSEDLTPTLLEFQRATLPKTTSISVLDNPGNPTSVAFLKDLRQRADALGMSVTAFEAHSREEIEAAFVALAAHRPDVLQLISDSGLLDLMDRI